MKAKILQVKMTSKKGLACLLAVLMLLTALPLGLVTSAMAATKDCMVVEVQGKKVYFFGAEALEVTGSKVAYTAESAEVPTIYVDGAVDPADDVQISDGVIDFGTWLADQSGRYCDRHRAVCAAGCPGAKGDCKRQSHRMGKSSGHTDSAGR